MKVSDVITEELANYEENGGQDCNICIMQNDKQVACEYIEKCPGDIKEYMDKEVFFAGYYSESVYIFV